MYLRLVVLFALAPALASAQATNPTDAAPSAPRDAPATEERRAGPAASPEDTTYTIQRGDTLWDLSARFLTSPWYWPKLWSHNPQIANPHFIYPGNVVRLRATGDSSGRLDAASPATAEADEEIESPRELDDLSRADMKRPQDHGDGDEVAVVGPYRIGYVSPRAVYAKRETFVTASEMEESGTVTAAFEDKLLLTVYDRAYARFGDPSKVRVGERYLLYRTERPVRHPVTGAVFGYQTTVLGTARVVAVDARAVTIEIVQASEPIQRGALIAPWSDGVVKAVQRRPNARDLAAVIVATQRDVVSEIGEHHVVFLDKGRADGVEEGNVFSVLRAGDPYGTEMNRAKHDPRLPIEDIGTLLVVDAQQTSSAALVVRSLREIYIGDQVRMRSPVAGSTAEPTKALGAPGASR